jgi:hypothetical protein
MWERPSSSILLEIFPKLMSKRRRLTTKFMSYLGTRVSIQLSTKSIGGKTQANTGNSEEVIDIEIETLTLY